jgi:hypothetical protein
MLGWFLPILLALTHPGATEPKVQTLGGWIAGCDNENICTALRTVDAVDAQSLDGSIPFLYIRHHPHRDAIPEIRIIDPADSALDAVLRPSVAMISLDFRARSKDGQLSIYYATGDFPANTPLNAPGSYRFHDEEVRTILYGLRVGVPAILSIGPKRIALNTAHLDDALAHFDREQDLADTPGALVLRPGNVMYDYAHPWPPEAPAVELARFTSAEFDRWLKAYLQQHPGQKVKHEAKPEKGLITAIHYSSFEFDCGVFERWGYERSANHFVLVERREMPVCSGIEEANWIRSFRADTISPKE